MKGGRRVMKRKIFIFMGIISVTLTFSFIVFAQGEKGGPPKTIKLPSGEMVYDLNGEWNALYEHFGTCMHAGSWKAIVKVKQEGNRFVGIKLSGGNPVTIGQEVIRGELDQKGYKKGEIYMPNWRLWADCKGKIADSCKKIIMDEGSCVQLTLERK
jgi:hypothetical protein